MNLIWLFPEMPFPADTGSRLTLSHRLKYAASHGCNNWAIVASKETPAEDAVCQLNACCVDSHVLIRSKDCRDGLIGRLAKGLPFAAADRFSSRIEDLISNICGANSIDAIIVEYPQMLINVPQNLPPNICLILEQHNIEWTTALSLANSCQNGLARTIRRQEARRLERYEFELAKSYRPTMVSFVTETDRLNYGLFESALKETLMPGASDYSSPFPERDSANIVYVSNLTYGPNVEGALWLAKEVFPKVRDHIPGVQLYLVGKGPSEEIQHLGYADSSIHVTGRVEDLTEYYELADVIALPIFTGGGINMKTLEAALSMRPIVATSFAAKGMSLKKNEHYIEANDSESFSGQIIEILSNKKHALDLATHCYEFASRNYSWDAVCSKWLSCIEECVGARR